MKSEKTGNNFKVLRLVAACLVIVGHAFPIMGHTPPTLLGNQISIYGLLIFFAVSGYLVTASWESDQHVGRFLRRRALRIFPGLFVAVAVTVFLFGPLNTSLPLRTYLSDSRTYVYFYNAALYVVYGLPETFMQNPIATSVNVSLWSLPVEFGLYLTVIAVFGALSTSRSKAIAAVATSITFALVSVYIVYFFTGQHPVFYGTDVASAAGMGGYFMAGAFLMHVGFIGRRLWIVLACFAGWVVATQFFSGFARYPIGIATPFLFTTIVVAIGAAKQRGFLVTIDRLPDVSYGMYLYAFPVQQTIARITPNMPVWLAIFSTLAITALFATASWYLVEKPFLSFKPRRRSAPRQVMSEEDLPVVPLRD